MSVLLTLQGENLRNLQPFHLSFSSRVNFFWGPNGSGKTSLLEAIYLLAHGRSFRTHRTQHFMHYEKEVLSLFGRISLPEQRELSVGLEKSLHAPQRLRVDGQPLKTAAELARHLPLQIVGPESYELLLAGPKYRRRYLDWGLFHVEQSFFPAWKTVRRCLDQRNQALKSQQSNAVIQAWDAELIQASLIVHALREQYLLALQPIFSHLQQKLFQFEDIALGYLPGWPADMALDVAMSRGLYRDRMTGSTQHGVHRADLQLYSKKTALLAEDFLSRGQQKLLFCALLLAQGVLLKELTGQACLYLLDDLPAELDSQRCQLVLETVLSLDAQIFLTAVSGDAIDILQYGADFKAFSVSAGEVCVAVEPAAF